MAITLKPLDQSGAKWSKRAQAAAPEYSAGVKAPKRDWAGATAAADNAYQAGVNAAIGRGAFSRGVRQAGTQKWQEKSSTLGAQRYSGGVTAAAADYQAGFAAYHAALGQVALPERGPRGSAQNLDRVRAVADALHGKRVSGS